MPATVRHRGRIRKKSSVERIDRIRKAFRAFRSDSNEENESQNVTPPTAVTDDGDIEKEKVNLTPDPNSTWNIGRRIIDLGHLIEQLSCTDCDKLLHLKDIVHETRHGLGASSWISPR